MKTYQSTPRNKKNLLKRNLYIVLIAVAVIAVATGVTLGVILNKPNDRPVATTTVFTLPLEEFTVAQEVRLDGFVYNPTLNEWRTVTGMTFAAEAGQDVNAIANGTIVSIDDTLLDGRAIVVEHSGGFVSVYKSLDKSQDTSLKVGDEVTADTVLGKTSNMMTTNAHFGNQLYLELKKDDKFVDPVAYLPQIDK